MAFSLAFQYFQEASPVCHFSALKVRQNQRQVPCFSSSKNPQAYKTDKHNSLGTSSTLVLEPGTDGFGRWEWREIQTAIFKTGITPRSRVGQGKFKCHNKALLLYLSLFWIQHSVDYYNPLIISQSSDNLLWQFLLSLVGFCGGTGCWSPLRLPCLLSKDGYFANSNSYGPWTQATDFTSAWPNTVIFPE